MNELPTWTRDAKDGQSLFSSNFAVILNPIYLISCAIHIWVELKAGIWTRHYQTNSACFQEHLIGEIGTCNKFLYPVEIGV
jgi:hypothetical protein